MPVVELRPCGTSGLRLPGMAIGCWSFGGGDYWGAQSQADVEAVVHRAIDLGITAFDTAEAYNGGASETSLGQALRGRRDRALVISKVSPHHASPAALRRSCEDSLRRLETDWIDLYLVHWPLNASSIRHYTSDEGIIGQPPDAAAAFATLNDLRREGKIRHLGVSNFGVEQLAEARGAGAELAANELPYNLLMRGIEPAVLPACARQGIGVLGYMALMQGVLCGPLRPFDELPAARTRLRHFSGSRPGARHGEPGIEAETWTALQAIDAIARGAGLPLADLALAWAMANPAVTCTIVGCRTVGQLEDNVRALGIDLSPEVRDHLDAATAPVLARLGPTVDYFQAPHDSRSR
jgi:aryl-alcohol dehydrogenase-like predicted oxidoreductase